ncbi:uncharacterized protein LOC133284165 [Gastrolobium bilobum]|uniref:uncharacterized protein LOC133284165 n=1 Tax=Gastrolobium bilobum TaxID=150636 RepID=UPI002AB2FB25|nr:uncharacterized protein LOC133284165 [Gastrolobium bilobum]
MLQTSIQLIRMALASATVTISRSLIQPRPIFLAYRNNHATSRIFQFRYTRLGRSLSAMTSPQAASSDSTNSSSTKTERVVIKGRVQGVWYRNWTIENATSLGLKGWVRNRKDGSVEALFSGSTDAVQEMEQRCRRGPPDAVVTGIEVFPGDDDPGTGFQRKPTI